MRQTSQSSQPNDSAHVKLERTGILLGLPPFLLWVVANVLLMEEGRCQPHTVSSLLAYLAIYLWVAEMVGSLPGLFVSRKRALAQGLLATLWLSFPLGLILGWLTLTQTICMHFVF
ncbi:MAG TPA: hypothetical protein VH593_03130 [Ktedonobacteraceae bacterium]